MTTKKKRKSDARTYLVKLVLTDWDVEDLEEDEVLYLESSVEDALGSVDMEQAIAEAVNIYTGGDNLTVTIANVEDRT